MLLSADRTLFLFEGHYKALEWNEAEQKYVDNPNLGILVEVDVRLFTLLCTHNMKLISRLDSGTRDWP